MSDKIDKSTMEISEIDFFSPEELVHLLKKAEEIYAVGIKKKQKSLVKAWFLIHTALFTGLKRFELCNLKISDINQKNNRFSFSVGGSGSHSARVVELPNEYSHKVLRPYIKWKKDNNEFSYDAYLLQSSRGEKYSVSGLWCLWKKYSLGKKLQCARHTYGLYLYQTTKNLKTIQVQMGHSRISTSAVYANILQQNICLDVDSLSDLATTLKIVSDKRKRKAMRKNKISYNI